VKGIGINAPIKDSGREAELFRRRAQIGFLVIALMTALLGARYLYLQVFTHDAFSTRSESNRVNLRPVAPNRGLIYDRRGRVLADNQPAFLLQLVPEKVDDLPAVLTELQQVVDLGDEDIERFERARKRYREFESVPVRFNLSEQEIARFAVNQHRFEGVEVTPYLARRYPYGELLTHVLGYVGRLDERDLQNVDRDNYRASTHIGKLGVEGQYEDVLHGTSGFEKVETNARGRVLTVLERGNPQPGNDLVLAIDVAVQRAAWEALGDLPGSVVAIDPRDGAIIALVSKPSFDPNLFVHGIGQADYQAILEQRHRPLFNRALAGGYEPGSTLKPFIGLAALELGVIGREHRTFSNGEFYLPDFSRPFRDWKQGGHGWVDMRDALAESVNTYFYELAVALGIDRIHDYLAQFGFGSATGIDLPGESDGLLPSREWKRERFNQPWYPGETVISGIGQGFNVATPLQLAVGLAALIGEGRLWQPHVLYASKQAGDSAAERMQPRLVRQIPMVDAENWRLIEDGMRDVVNTPGGTARDVALNADYVIAGKTGTSQVFALAQDRRKREAEVPEELRDHALFIAYAPYNDPIIAVAVVVDHGGAGSRVAAPVARATIDAWLAQELAP
jgi:penicillin-binding protein 2